MFNKREKKQEEMDSTVLVKKPKKKLKKRYIVIGIVAIIIVINVIGSMTATNQPALVNVKKVTKGDIVQSLDTSGLVESEEIKVYFAKASGQIETLPVTAGSTVKQGENLLTYNVAKLEKEAKQAQLEVTASEYGLDATLATLNHAQAKSAEAAKDYDDAVKYVEHYTACVNKVKEELNKASKAAKDVENLTNELAEAQKKLEEKPNSEKRQKKVEELSKELKNATKEAKKYDVEALQASLEVNSADLAAYEGLKEKYEMEKETDPALDSQKAQQAVMKQSNSLSREQITDNLEIAKSGVQADFDGIVTEVSAVEGQSVMEGTQLFTIANDKKVKVTIQISKYDLQKIALNQPATIDINNHMYEGYVARIARMAQMNASGASVLNAEIHINNPDENIYLGVEGKVSIQTADKKDVLLLPIECINSDKTGDFCYVVENNTIVRKDVVIGIISDEYTEIVSGLKEGEQVVSQVTGEIVEGMAVTPVEDEADASVEDETDTSQDGADDTAQEDEEAQNES